VEGDRRVDERVPARLNRVDGRRFAFTIGSAFLALGMIAWFRHHPILLIAFGFCGAASFLAGCIVPTKLTRIWQLWMGLAHGISRVTTPIAMSAVYFLAFTPVGIIKRLAGSNALRRPEGARGYWVRRDTGQNARSDLERQF
jgi:hypothetical protein